MTSKFDEAIRRLRGNSDFEEIVKGLRDLLQTRTEELVYRQDTVGTHRLQGSVATLSELLKDLAP